MKLQRLIRLTARSIGRLAKAQKKLEETGDFVWLWFLKKESNILLKRAVTLWIRIRLGRGK